MVILAILFVISRFGFLAGFPHFFDSPEYVRLAQADTFLGALKNSHESLHPVYLFLIQVFYKAFGSIQAISAVSALFGLFSIIGFAWLLYELGYKHNITRALLLLLLFPATWLLQTNVMHESVGHAFLLFSVASLFRWFNSKKIIWALIATVMLATAYLNYVGLILWLPVIIVLVWWKELHIRKSILILGLSLVLGQASLWLLMQQAGIEQTNRFGYIFSVELPQILQLITPIGFLRILRNVVYMIAFGYTPLIVIGLGKWWKKRDMVLMSVGFVSLMASMSFWHGGLYGRLGSLIGFGLAGLVSVYPLKSWRYQLVLWSSLLLFIYTAHAYVQPSHSLITLNNVAKISRLPDDLIVISGSERPQLEYLGLRDYFEVSPQNTDVAIKRIQEALGVGRRVFITAQALTTPYWQYDGQQVHIISKGSRNGVLYKYLQNKKLQHVSGEGLFAVYELLIQ